MEANHNSSAPSYQNRSPEAATVQLELFEGGDARDGGRCPCLTNVTDIYVDRTATPGFNPETDTYRMMDSSALIVSVSTDGSAAEDLSVKAYPAFTEGQQIPLTVRVPKPGAYELRPLDVQNLPDGLAVSLQDSRTGKAIMLQSRGTAYAFSLTDEEAARPVVGRFVLSFERAA